MPVGTGLQPAVVNTVFHKDDDVSGRVPAGPVRAAVACVGAPEVRESRGKLVGTRTAIIWVEFLAAAVEGQKCEWIDGEVLQMSPVNLPHEQVLALLIEYLVDYCRLHSEWFWFPFNGAFTMASGNWRLPDASLQGALSWRTSYCEHGRLCARRGV
jgi:hypothetical protein